LPQKKKTTNFQATNDDFVFVEGGEWWCVIVSNLNFLDPFQCNFVVLCKAEHNGLRSVLDKAVGK
jgi:hypothetical protein